MTYLGCLLDENLSGESIALKVINKTNSRLRLLYGKNRLLFQPLRKLLCNALILSHFDYTCSAWYSNFHKRLKSKLQIPQMKCLRFCLNSNNRAQYFYQSIFAKIKSTLTENQSRVKTNFHMQLQISGINYQIL